MILLENKFYTISFESNNSLIITRWKSKSKDLKDTSFKEQILMWLEELKKCGAKKILIDTIHFKFMITPEVQEWFDQKVFAIYPSLGIEKKAFLVSPDIFTQVSLEQHAEPLIE